MKNRNRKIKFNKNFLYAAVAIITFAISAVLSYANIKNFNWNSIFSSAQLSDITTENHDYPMCVHFLNVGKADCAYINCENKNILIDAADKDTTDTVIEYLKRLGVKKLDLVIISHPHRDHIGQMERVVQEFEIEQILEPDIPANIIPTSVTYEKLLNAIKNKNIKVSTPKAGNQLAIGNLKLKILGPINSGENINNNSLVVKIIYKNISFLFTGDCEKSEENDIINRRFNLKSTVLKVAHHGSNTSSTYKFLGKVRPEYAVISVGQDRSNLPKEKVLNRIDKFGSKIYRTDINGNIIFLTDGEHIEVKTEK